MKTYLTQLLPLLLLTLVIASPGMAKPEITDFWPPANANGITNGFPYYVEVSGLEENIPVEAVNYSINGTPTAPLVKPIPNGYRYLVWPPCEPLPLQTMNIGFQLTVASEPQTPLSLSYDFQMSRWPKAVLIPGYEGHPIYGMTSVITADGVTHLAINDDHRLLYVTYQNGQFSEPVVLALEVWKTPIIKGDLLGVLHLLWYSTAEGGVLRYTNNFYGDFSRMVEFNVWMFPYSESMPYDMAIDYQQGAHIVWTEEGWVDSALYYSDVTLWMTPEILTVNQGMQPYLEPRIAVNFLNLPLLVWKTKSSNYDTLWWAHMKSSGTEFAPPKALNAGYNLIVNSPQLSINPNGISYVVWVESADYGAQHFVTFTADEEARGKFLPPRRLASLDEPFRMTGSSLFPDKIFLLCFADSGVYYLTNTAGAFGVLERVSPVKVGYGSLVRDLDNVFRTWWYGGESEGLLLFEGREPRHRPSILAAGWLDTFVTATAGGMLHLGALVDDAGNDASGVEVWLNGCPTGVMLQQTSSSNDGTTYWELMGPAPAGLPAGNYGVELVASDQWGATSTMWPRFQIVPSPDFGSAPGAAAGAHEYAPGAPAAVGDALTVSGKGCVPDGASDSLTDSSDGCMPDDADRRQASPGSHAPRIELAGFWQSALSTAAGGELQITAAVADPGEDVEAVLVLFNDEPAAILHDDGEAGDPAGGDGIYNVILDLPPGIAWGNAAIKLEAIDSEKNLGWWPQLQIAP